MFKFKKPSEKPFRRCVLVCALLFGICAASPPLGAGAAELTNDSIRQKEASIEQSKKERRQIESNISDLKSIKKDLESSKQNLQQYVTNLDAQVTSMQGKIDDLNQKISTKKTEISEKEKELAQAEKQRDDQYEVMKKRIKFIYERGNGYYLEILIKSGSFSDMLNRATYVSMLSDYDQKQLEELAQKAKEVSLAKQDLEEEKKTLDAAEQSVRSEQSSMQSLIADKKTQIDSLSSEITTKEESIRQYEAERRSRIPRSRPSKKQSQMRRPDSPSRTHGILQAVFSRGRARVTRIYLLNSVIEFTRFTVISASIAALTWRRLPVRRYLPQRTERSSLLPMRLRWEIM